MNFVPLHADRLGFRRTRGGSEHALGTGTAIPANESIIVCNWMRCDLDGSSTDHYIGVGPMESVGGERVSILRNGDDLKLGCNDGVWQSVTVPIPDSGDHLWTIVVDRDNTLLDVWLDATLVYSSALTNDPDLTANNQIQLNNSTGGANSLISWTCWRGLIQTFANGSTPTQAQIQDALRAMLSPDAPVHANISGAVGSVYNDWSMGDGIYGATTITDNGTSGDDLTLQGGLAIEDVRVRAMTPARTVGQDWYALNGGYTADTGATAFGFAVQPVIARMSLGRYLSPSSTTWGARLYGGLNEYMAILIASGVVYVRVRANGWNTNYKYEIGRYGGGGDLWMVVDGTDYKVFINGQHVYTGVLPAALDLTGTPNITIDGNLMHICRIAAWNPTTVPANLLDEIRACVMNPEVDPPSLTNKRVDFPLNETTLPLATSTTVANQGLGGGTLTLSAQRSTSCAVMFAGRS